MNKIKFFLAIFTLTLLVTSCYNEEKEISEASKTENSILGKKLENPYSVENMRIALNNLKEKNSGLNKGRIATSHLYIKFIPKNEDDISLLKIDSTLNLFDYPMDYTAIEGQDNYRDPEVPEDQPTYQYASVKVDYKLPDVEYEVLEELFIPEEIEIKNEDDFYINELVDEALKITHNLEGENSSENVQGRRPKWRPSGRILIRDDAPLSNVIGAINISNTPYVAPVGLKVRATRWFTTHRGFVNSSGYFSCDGRFRGSARYRIDWERYHFALRSGGISSAQHQGPYQRSSWNWRIENGNIHQYYGTIFRAAYHYYYQNILNLRRPPPNSSGRTQLRIAAYTQSNPAGGTHDARWAIFGLRSKVKIYTANKTNLVTYAATIHELAHAAHWNMDRSDWGAFGNRDLLRETWARGVEWRLTNTRYRNYVGGETFLPRYTPLVTDLIDFPNAQNRGSYDLSEDNVSGYTIKQLEDALSPPLLNDNGHHGDDRIIWKERIKNNYNNGTENNLDRLFDYW